MHTRRSLRGVAAVALVAALTGCGGDSGSELSAAEQEKAAEFAAEMTADTSEGNPFGDEEAATCFAEGIVSAMGLDRIEELETGAGISTDFADMTTTEQAAVAGLALDCIDFRTMLKDQLVAAGATEEAVTCVSDGLDDALLEEYFLATMRGEDPSENGELADVLTGCIDEGTATEPEPSDSGSAEPDAAESATTGEVSTFGETVTWPNGLAVSVSAPAPYTPSDTAAADPAAAYVMFTVTVVNGTAANFDPTMFMVSVQSGSTEGSQVFDAEKDVGLPPNTALLPGREVAFPVAFGVADPADIVMEVTPTWELDSKLFTS